MRVVFSGLKARGVAKLSVFKIMDFLWIPLIKGKIYSFWIYGKAPTSFRHRGLYFKLHNQEILHSREPGLNWRPHPYHGCALPTELSRQLDFYKYSLRKNKKKSDFSCFSLSEFFLVMLEGRVHRGERGDNLVRWILLLRSESW